MAMRPSWQGHLKLSLVACPVVLYGAITEARKPRFNLIDPQSGSRIKTVATAPSGDVGEPERQVDRTELVKGYEVDRGVYVTVTDEELQALRPERSKMLEIERFVPASEIDRLYWDKPYFLVPDGAVATDPYAVIREAMREEGQVALGRVVMSSRERLMALEVRGNGIIAHRLRTNEEVREEAEAFRDVPSGAVDQNMVAIAKQILKQHAGPFDPTDLRDSYAEAVRDLIERKRLAGEARATAGRPAVTEAKVIDLMAQLRASLQRGAPPAAPSASSAKAKRAASAAAPAKAPAARRKRAS